MSINTNVDERARNANVDNTTINGNLEPDAAEPPAVQEASAKVRATPKKRGKDKA